MNYTFGYKQEKLLFRSGTARARAGNPEGLGLVIHQVCTRYTEIGGSSGMILFT